MLYLRRLKFDIMSDTRSVGLQSIGVGSKDISWMTQLSVDSFDTELSESTRCCVTIEFTCNWNTGDAELNTAGE